MSVLVFVCEQPSLCNDNHQHVEGVFVADYLTGERCICAAVLNVLLEDLEALSWVPWLLHAFLVFV